MIILCFKIFLARILDVTIGTIRTMFIVKGNKIIASIFAFFELIIWYYAAREALNTEINSILIPISYALGFGVGTYLGIAINNKLINPLYEIEIYLDAYNNELKEFNPFIIKYKNKYRISIIINRKELYKNINTFNNLKKTHIYIKDIKKLI